VRVATTALALLIGLAGPAHGGGRARLDGRGDPDAIEIRDPETFAAGEIRAAPSESGELWTAAHPEAPLGGFLAALRRLFGPDTRPRRLARETIDAARGRTRHTGELLHGFLRDETAGPLRCGATAGPPGLVDPEGAERFARRGRATPGTDAFRADSRDLLDPAGEFGGAVRGAALSLQWERSLRDRLAADLRRLAGD